MSKEMKVLIAYDGSPCANEAIDDLQRAGLPPNVEAVVLSVADLWLLPEGDTVAPPPLGPSRTIREARDTAASIQEHARIMAATGAARVRSLFPTWKVTPETAADSPAWAIILKAEAWGADLIVVGSRGHSALGRWVLGSVSQTVLTHAHTSVRIARGRLTPAARPLRILVGIDGSIEADLAVRTVAQRTWPAGTDVRLMLVLNPSLLEAMQDSEFERRVGAASHVVDELAAGEETQGKVTAVEEHQAASKLDEIEEIEEIDSLIGRMFESYVGLFGNKSQLSVTTYLRAGDPKLELLANAEEWGADCIFLGSRGLNRWERLLLGSVSSAVAARAHCPVEVIRLHQKEKVN